MKNLELRIPPALVFLIFGGAMYLMARWLPVGSFDFFGRRWLTLGLCAMALLSGGTAIGQFLVRGASTDPAHPEHTRKLITGGMYHYSRNPMYLALLLLLLAWGLRLENAFNTLLAALFVAYMNRFQIRPEERALQARFGAEYRQYCKLVRRWF